MLKKRNRKRMHTVLHDRVRKRISGTTERPRLCVFRTARHIYAQIVDDSRGVVLAAESTLRPDVKSKVKYPGNVDAAKAVGEAIATRAQELNLKTVVFDRGGYKYHGRVKALADAVREKGLEF